MLSFTHETIELDSLFWKLIDCYSNTLGYGSCTDDRVPMTIYRYGLRFRPLSLGAQPKGFIPNPLLFQREINYANRYRWGYVDYPFMLDALDLKAYEMEYVGERSEGTAEPNPESA